MNATALTLHMSLLEDQTASFIVRIWRERGEANPAGRFGDAEELGALCAFVASSHAGYITGQSLLIDGGSYPGTF